MSQSAFYDLAVIDNVPFGLTGSQGRFFALRLERPDWKSWAPGQFVMLRPQGWALDMPWARPFSICRVSTNELVIFFQVAGRGTEKMAKLRRGDKVHLWGPLGNRFAVEGGTPTLLLAGGIGIAPGANINYATGHAIFEATHGTAPDIAGKGIANPIATILSAAMMLRYSFDLDQEADAIEAAVEKVLEEGYRTIDIMSEGMTQIGTKEMGERICSYI